MNRVYAKNISRTVKISVGRYIAIFAIIALGVGFFSGLKVTKPAMVETGNHYIKDHSLYDFKILSTYGISDDEVAKAKQFALDAEGAYSQDFIYCDFEGTDSVIKACSVTERINSLSLVSGRMPQNSRECVVDAYHYGDSMLGKTIAIGDDNTEETKERFAYDEFLVVGTVHSPVYLNYERGTTSLGNGRLEGFLYLLPEAFTFPYYTELYVKCLDGYDIYTEEYDEKIAELTPAVQYLIDKTVQEKYDTLLAEAEALGADVSDIEPPQVYVLDRNTNIGYVCFKNDSAIVEGIAKVFPVFFFLIAALVCSTTMTRMIDDERGQIGTFRALGYGNGAIMAKYMIYSGSAAGIGAVAGFFVGTNVFPRVIWATYDLMYGFAKLDYYFSPLMLCVSLAVALLCSVGTTYVACRNELRCMPAELIRPKAPAVGKRILLERLTPLWKRMKFLHKVTARNIFRFKKRMLMMIIGIAGCMALVITGLGLKDSISNIAAFQYDEIERFHIDATFSEPINDSHRKQLSAALGDTVDKQTELYKTSVEYQTEDVSKTVYLAVANDGALDGFVDFHLKGNKVAYPKDGEVLLSKPLADLADVGAGDDFTFTLNDGRKLTLTVSGVFENYVWHYAYITPQTYETAFGQAYEPNSVYINMKKVDDSYEAGAALADVDGVMNVNVVAALRDRIANMMKTLNAVVWLVIGCAAALAFIVLINLSNINITERVREIATIKVLGFYSNETGAYVFRENLVLTLMGIVVGLPLGRWLHRFVISQIKIDLITFKITIFPVSCIAGVLIVLLFLVLVDLLMRRKLDGIDMAESLKSIE